VTPPPLQLGILGTGNIARQFAQGLAGAQRCQAAAVASRQAEQANQFAQTHGINRAYGDYAALLEDPAVEAIYLALPNHAHYRWTMQALEAGKHVLCEKPLAPRLHEAEAMFEQARAYDRHLVEGFMYQSHPQTRQMLDAVRAGQIGDLKMIRTSFCIRTRTIEGNVRFDPAMAGGSLMDVGCYCLSFSRLIAGEEPAESHITGHLHASGVDQAATGTLTFPSGVLANFACGLTVQGDNRAIIQGTEGYIEAGWPWKPQGSVQYTIARMTPPKQDAGRQAASGPAHYTVEADRPLFALEADDFAATVQDGAAPRVSEAHTLGNVALLEQFRQAMGLTS
jgi:predicted dehydrogenase